MTKKFSIFRLDSNRYPGHRVGDIFQTCYINYKDGLIYGYKLFDCERQYCLTFRLDDVYIETLHSELAY